MRDLNDVRGLRLRSRAAVLRHIVGDGPTTRAKVAAASGLSPGSVTNVVSDLMAEGIVQETGSIPSDGGRPVAVLETVPSGAAFIGVDVGERGVAAELFDLRLAMLDREFCEAESHLSTPSHVAGALTAAVTAVRDRNAEIGSRLVGIGLGLPGIVEEPGTDHSVLYAQNLGWPPIAIGELLPISDVPVLADNGAKTLAAAELWFGAARNAQQAAVALLGRGVGLAITSNGRTLRGSRSSAGEWGHCKVTIGGPECGCGSRGCLESYVGAAGILRRWADTGAPVDGTGWRALSSLVQAAGDGDPAALRVVDETITILGTALGNVVNLFNPDRIVVGGWVGILLMSRYAEAIATTTKAASLSRPGEQFELRTAAFAGDSVAIGAALLPLEELIRRPQRTPEFT